MTTRVLRFLSLAAVIGAARVTRAAEPDFSLTAIRQLEALVEAKRNRTPNENRISSTLLAAMRMQRGEPVAAGVPTLSGVWERVKLDAAGRTEVDIQADVSDELLEALGRIGVVVETAYPQYRAIRAWAPLQKLTAIGELDEVAHVRPAGGYTTNTGPSISQGDAAHRAPAVRALSVLGAGAKVGVLSDGVNSLAARQAAGDLPAGVTVLSPGSGDEGTAMLEIVYDLAPAAQLYYATGIGGEATMAANIQALASAGCNVIVDDLTYFAEGAFQDGPIAQAVNAVTAGGVLYFSSAGNSGNKNDGTSGTWEGDYVEGGVIGTQPVHTFSGQTSNLITANAGPISLKWSDPLAGSTNDYDLYIFNNALTTVVDASDDVQAGGVDPLEIVNSQAAGNRVVVVRFSGQPRALRVDTNRGRLSVNTEGNTFGHNAASGAVTVAATDARAAAGGAFVGGASNPVETYSSDGPRRMFYNANGTAITPGNVLFGTGGGATLLKPDLTAADCVTTGTAGFTTFCGTSAAAPHASAIAALALSTTTAPLPATVKAMMLSTALNIEAAGTDRDSGAGITMANLTVLPFQPTPPTGASRFFTVAPCRVADTRNAAAALGGPAVPGLGQRVFFVAGSCGVPTTAKALSINVTITGPVAPGDLRIFPIGVATPLVSAINFAPGQTRANNAVVQVSGGGKAAIGVQNDSQAAVHFILDVNGYFE